MDSKIYYFNNAATTWPKPKNVIDAVHNYFNNPPINSSRHCNCIKKNDDIDVLCKNKIAEFFNVDTSKYDITITGGATYSANIVINWLSKINDNNVELICDNSLHNSIYRTHFEKIGTKPTIIDNWYNPPDYLEFKENTNHYLAISHVNNVDGTYINDEILEHIFKCVRPMNIPVILDITQSAGTYDIDTTKYNYDNLYIICSGHKGLYSTTGIGFLISPKNRINIPFISGGTGGIKGTDYKHTDSLEAGTPNELAIVSLYEGIKFIQNNLYSIRIIKNILTEDFIRKINSMKNLDKFSTIFELCPYYERLESGIVAFKNLDKNKCQEFIDKLTKDYNIIIRNGVHCAPLYHINWLNCDSTMRISFSMFNTRSEINYLIKAFEEITDIII